LLGRKHAGNAKRGFTLVEVIVVLVILAILAAIAIPALTGYINKARDKQYVMMARDYVTATKAVLNEAYATGELGKNDPLFLNTGNSGFSGGFKYFGISTLSQSDFGTGLLYEYNKKAGELVAKKHPGSTNLAGHWTMVFIGNATDSTLLNADGFLFFFWPEAGAFTVGNPVIAVTYKVDHIDNISTNGQLATALQTTASYNPTAGYEVYDMVVGS
jgi:prepilin-type N-terminal cleavage/methylation domain-containing protein